MKGKLANGVSSQYSYTTSEHGVSSITATDAHTSAAFERRNLVSVRVPSHFKRSLHGISCSLIAASAQNEETMGDFKRALSSKQMERRISI